MLNVKILARRTTRGASLWFFDPIGLLVFVASGAVLLLIAPHAWWVAPPLLLATCWTAQLRIDADHPATGTARTFWTVIPIRRRSFDPAQLTHSGDDFVESSPDKISDGSWSFSCYRADVVAAWLRDAQRDLMTPAAFVRNPDDSA